MKIPFYVSMMCAEVQVSGSTIMRGGLGVSGGGVKGRVIMRMWRLTRLCITYVVMIIIYNGLCFQGVMIADGSIPETVLIMVP